MIFLLEEISIPVVTKQIFIYFIEQQILLTKIRQNILQLLEGFLNLLTQLLRIQQLQLMVIMLILIHTEGKHIINPLDMP